MWPRDIPREVRENPYRATEITVFEALRCRLDESFVVFYSRPWHGLAGNGQELDGECDFVVAHPDLGMLALEVKGGRIDYDPENERWTSTNRHGTTFEIKNPVQQARSSKHQLLKKLRESGRLGDRRINARHGVVFPDCAEPSQRILATDFPRDLACFEREFARNIDGWICRRLSSDSTADDGHRSNSALGHQGIEALTWLLARPIHLAVPLARRLRDDQRDIDVITREQFRVLRGLESNPRVCVTGPAGTGKTVLALEEAVRLADEGLSVVVLCFNQGLALDLRARLGSRSLIQVGTFHEYCGRTISRAGLAADPVPGRDFYKEVLPERLMDAVVGHAELHVDAVIVDEAQDFASLWWTAIDAVLSPGGARTLRIFFDSNQVVYNDRDLPPNLLKFNLTENLRNTRAIFDVSRPFLALAPGARIEAKGPQGEPVDWTCYASANGSLERDVQRIVVRLIRIERVDPTEIAVLVANEPTREAVRASLEIPTSLCTEDISGSVVVDTVRRFKGLERSVVVLLADQDVVLSRELTYVAITRARTKLIVLGDVDCVSAIRSPG